jgi:hypothetical protein
MESGILYVIFNKWIRDPETNEMPYKIGITRNSIEDRYYGLGLKMPGKFETLFAYKIKDYSKAEQYMHGIFNKYCVNGEWFKLNQNELNLIKANCEMMDGILVTDEIKEEIENEAKNEIKNNRVLGGNMQSVKVFKNNIFFLNIDLYFAHEGQNENDLIQTPNEKKMRIGYKLYNKRRYSNFIELNDFFEKNEYSFFLSNEFIDNNTDDPNNPNKIKTEEFTIKLSFSDLAKKLGFN